MSDVALIGASAVGAVLADLLSLTAAMRTGRIRSHRWRQRLTYLGIFAQACITAALAYFLLDYIKSPLAALAFGVNVPLIVEKLAQISPSFTQPELAHNPGFAEGRSSHDNKLERLRIFLAKEDEPHSLQ